MKSLLPRKVFDQHIVLLGKTRAGKSTVLRGSIGEPLLEQGEPVIIIDPKGDWWGLKLSKDGRGPGFPIVIFGGEHADVPLDPRAGAHIGELLATGNRPALIDMGGWMPAERTRFWIDFASALFRHVKGRRWLLVDEVHNFAPKGKVLSPDAGMALHWTNRLASEGLGKGIHMAFASQRPQKVHNDTLTSAETLIALKVIHKADRDAVWDWVDGCGDKELGKQLLASLAHLNRAEGWAWSPEAEFGPERIQFPMFKTYDSFRPQTVADTEKLKGWAQVNIEDVRTKLATFVEEAKANDPSALKAEIRRLTAELAKKPAPAADAPISAKPEQIEAARQRGWDARGREDRELLKAALVSAKNAHRRIGGMADECIELRAGLQEIVTRIEAVPELPAAALPTPTPGITHRQEPFNPPDRFYREKPATKPPAEGVNGPMQRILDALAWWEAVGVNRPSKVQVAVVANYSPGGGAFNNPLGRLRSMGFVEPAVDGTISLMALGRAAANAPATPPTTAEMHQRAMAILNWPQQRILAPLLAKYPLAMAKEVLAEAAGYSPDGGAFNNPLGSLRSLGFIDYPQRGHVVAQPILFVGR